jgi:hypothetical protein
LQSAFLAYFRTMPYGKQRGSKGGEQHSSSGDNPIAAKPVQAMGLPVFLPPVFMPRHWFALCHAANTVWAGGRAKIDA